MKDVIIYTKPECPFSKKAKNLLKEKGVHFDERDVLDEKIAKELREKCEDGCATVPQVFIDGELIGGYDRLAALDEEGKLDALLSN